MSQEQRKECNTANNLAISSANFTASAGFRAPFFFKYARRSPWTRYKIKQGLEKFTDF